MNNSQAQAIIRQTRENYNKIARHFSGTRQRVWPEFDYLKNFINDGQTILDWGCGNGRFILGLEGRKNIRYFGVDQSDELIKIARQTYRAEIKAGWAHFFSNAKRNKKFPDNFFDAAFLIASFFHLPDEDSRLALLKQIYRELKPGGKIIILVWNLGSDWAKAKIQKDWKVIGEHDFLIPWKNPQGELICERYYHHFTPEELSGLLRVVGFRVDKLDFFNGTWSDSKGGRNLVAVATK